MRTSSRPLAALLLAGSLTACGSYGSQNTSSAVTAGTGDAATPTIRTTATGDAPLVVAEAWITAVPDVSRAGSANVYAQIVNQGGDPVRITSVTTNASPRTRLQQATFENGRTAPKDVAAVTINPGVALVLQPAGANRLTVTGLTRPIAPGSQVTVTMKSAHPGTW